MPESNNSSAERLSTESYKGVRDFYPEDLFIQNYMFSMLRKVVEKFGYEEYNASVLESADLYRAKTGEEIVNEQTYTFTDRGGREVTLRPEMTPTVARMVAAKRQDLAFPLRWYSIPNLFRYERPQRGRLREHWQLNVDLFGVSNVNGDVEAISVAYEILKAFGLKNTQFEIRVNSRKIMNYILNDLLQLQEENAYRLSKLIDKKEKMETAEFEKGVKEIIGEKDAHFLELLNSQNFEEFVSHLPEAERAHEGVMEIRALLEMLEGLGITNVRFVQTLMRGFDYYTGIVFEVFDTNPENRRSLFGGGRYDELLAIFDASPVPAVGFGMGDVTLRNVLETYHLLPVYTGSAKLAICVMNESLMPDAHELAQELREQGVSVAVDYTGRKIGDQIKAADKHGVPFVLCLGEEEVSSQKFKVKELKTREETVLEKSGIAPFILKVR